MPNSKTYLVGGAVRDHLLGLAVHERDYVVVGSTPQALVALGYTQVGKDFPVFLHPKSKQEYALARTERKAGQGHKGFQVHATIDVTLEDDLLRRDLTINAIAQAPDGQLIDPYGGQRDLQTKQLRHVSQAFSEDPLRVLRTARFAAHLYHLGFSIAPETKNLLLAITQSGELGTLAKERIWQETHKALASQSPWVYFEVLEVCGALQQLMPSLAELLNRRPHALNTLKLLSESSTTTEVRLTGLLYQLNKPQIEDLAAQIKMPNVHKALSLSTSNHQRQLRAYTELDAAQKHLMLSNLGLIRSTDSLDDLLNVCQAVSLSQEPLFGWQSPKQHIVNDLENIHSVNPVKLMAQGFTGKGLGEELKKAQIESIRSDAG
jgi:tRNA nucleotidyltransferase (CCA-adding enzyme)|tara:strand:+ start:7396 stop:8526 length:1131 start_codon:yes stop_codon:yes gene_type:complete